MEAVNLRRDDKIACRNFIGVVMSNIRVSVSSQRDTYLLRGPF